MSDKPKHSDFLADLEGLLKSFGHSGTGAAEATGISSNKKTSGYCEKRTLADYQGDVVDPDWDHPRKAAYLASYVKTFGPKFSYERFEFDEGQMHSDMANMKTHLKYGCIEADPDGHFILTEKGRALIAPFVRLSDKDMEQAHAAG